MKDGELNEKDLRNAAGSGNEQEYEFVVKEGNIVYANPTGNSYYVVQETVMTNDDRHPVKTLSCYHARGTDITIREEKIETIYWLYSCRDNYGGFLG